jgi:hypothetical protein
MPFALENWKNKAIVVNTKTGKHYSTSPIPIATARRQMRLLEAVTNKK